jgi:cbb3-type cytochrome oxidase maturation protein
VSNLVLLIPVALFLGGLGLGAFLWALRSGQYEDLDGAAERILHDEPRPARESIGGKGARRFPHRSDAGPTR